MLTKLVNGKRVPLDAAEESAIQEEWAKPAAPVNPSPITATELWNMLRAKGIVSDADLPDRLRS